MIPDPIPDLEVGPREYVCACRLVHWEGADVASWHEA